MEETEKVVCSAIRNGKLDAGLKDMSLEEIIDQLTSLHNNGCGHWKVRIVTSSGTKSCVGKIVGIGHNDAGAIYLFPVPEDIERINALTKVMAMTCCDKASNGQDCSCCEYLTSCEHMKRFEENFKIVTGSVDEKSDKTGEAKK